MVEWCRALDVRLSEWWCILSMVWVQIPSREEQTFDTQKSNSNTVWFNFQTYIYVEGRTKIAQLKNLILTLFGWIFKRIYKNLILTLFGWIFRRIYIYVWKLNQTVLELDFWAVKFVFFTRRNWISHHWYTAAPFA